MMHFDWQRVAREVWKAPEEIAARFTGDEIVSDSLLALHQNHPEIKIMYCCSVRDAALTQMEMYLEDGRWIPDKAAGMSFQRKLKEMLEKLQPRQSRLRRHDKHIHAHRSARPQRLAGEWSRTTLRKTLVCKFN